MTIWPCCTVIGFSSLVQQTKTGKRREASAQKWFVDKQMVPGGLSLIIPILQRRGPSSRFAIARFEEYNSLRNGPLLPRLYLTARRLNLRSDVLYPHL